MTLLISLLVKKIIQRMNCRVTTEDEKMKIKKLLNLNMKITVIMKENKRKEKSVVIAMITVTSPVVKEMK